jgi:hypothetical protein|tara:strand:+ start:2427 stop:2786 length:360 start_codon:yes stop_codon:yes gene_type:complete
MKAHIASLVNALVLISIGLWGYLDSDPKAVTALIPVIIGIILLLINIGVKNENKVVAHIAVLLTLIILIGLIKPLMGSIERGDSLPIIRVIVMIFTSAWALKSFIQSFIEARKARESNK